MKELENEIYHYNEMDAEVKFNIAIQYICRDDITPDIKQFFKLIKTSAFQGYAVSQYIVGIFYKDGIKGIEDFFNLKIVENENWSCKIDYEKSLQWFKKSASKGYEPALYMTGYMYENSLGVEKDLKKALTWYKKAAKLGNEDALNKLEHLKLAI